MKVNSLHPWALDTRRAREVQQRLRTRVRRRPIRLGDIDRIAGADVAVSKRLDRLVAVVVVMRFPDLEVVESRVATAPPRFPYVPGLLSFREIPALAACVEKVRSGFDVLLCDGQGIAHPRGFGLASHLGVLLDVPTIGCAKSRLVGDHDDVGPSRGEFAPLTLKGRRIGDVLRTRDGVKPIFVSPGHLADVPSCRRVVLAASPRYRVPEPTRQADIIADREKRALEG